MDFDYCYLCDNLGHLCGLQTRLYEGEELVHQYSFYELEPDLITLVLTRIAAEKRKIAFFDASDTLVFGMIRIPGLNISIVVGPTSAIKPTEKQARAVLRQLGELESKLPALCGYFDNMICYPLENFLQILCFCSYVLNGEKVTVAELLEQQTDAVTALPQTPLTKPTESEPAAQHNTYEMEKQMLGYITAGQPDRLKQMFSGPPTGRPGQMAGDSLRQQKNLFICVATLASRAAIAGGLPHEVAFSLSDKYIQKCELFSDISALSRLSIAMLHDYAQRVEWLRAGQASAPLVVSVTKYVSEHIDAKITSGSMAPDLYMNRQHLCRRFKEETGMTVGEFIRKRKIDEAKRLLATSDLPIAQISDFLGFSSQSYFQNVFKRMDGKTPNEFRMQCGTGLSPTNIP